jgi:hypothetical protein
MVMLLGGAASGKVSDTWRAKREFSHYLDRNPKALADYRSAKKANGVGMSRLGTGLSAAHAVVWTALGNPISGGAMAAVAYLNHRETKIELRKSRTTTLGLARSRGQAPGKATLERWEKAGIINHVAE